MELKEKEPTSYSFGAQFEPSDEPVKQPLDDNEGIVVDTALSAEQPVEEEDVFMYNRNLYVDIYVSPTVVLFSLKMHHYPLLCFIVHVSVIS